MQEAITVVKEKIHTYKLSVSTSAWRFVRAYLTSANNNVERK